MGHAVNMCRSFKVEVFQNRGFVPQEISLHDPEGSSNFSAITHHHQKWMDASPILGNEVRMTGTRMDCDYELFELFYPLFWV